MSNGQEAVLVAADTEEEMLPESEETALALNVEELRFWVKQVCNSFALACHLERTSTDCKWHLRHSIEKHAFLSIDQELLACIIECCHPERI